MNNKTLKRIAVGVVNTALMNLPLLAAAQGDRFGVNYGTGAGLGTRDIRATIAAIINVALGILGIVALIIILVGGFKWMTAAGNDEAIDSAKKTIGAGVIGLIIIFVAYALTVFIFNVLSLAQ